MELNEAIEKAEHGKNLLDKMYVNSKGNKQVLLFPTYNEQVFSTVKKYFRDFIKDLDHIVVVSSVDIQILNKEIGMISHEIFKVSEEDMDDIIRFAVTINDSQIKIISLINPSSQKIDKLIGCKDVDLDMIIKRIMLGIWR